jgi:CelD/BcsL family acetyltransferase involved in cellulose biosynthesis
VTGISARVVTEQGGFADLRPAWTQLLHASEGAHAFASWEWANAWWQHFRGEGDELHVVVFESGNGLDALAPFVLTAPTGRLGPRVLVSLGHEHADYGGLLLGPDPHRTLPALLAYCDEITGSSNTVVELVRIPTDGPLFTALSSHYRDHGRLVMDRHETVPNGYLDFTQLDDPLAHVAKLAKRHDAPREYRRLGRNFDTSYAFDVDWPTSEALDVLFELHGKRWNEKHDDMQGLFAGARTQAFAVDAIAALRDAGMGRMSFVTAGGKPVVGSIGYVCRDVFSWHKFAFDPEFNTYSPGHVILSLMLESAAAAGLREFNFGRGDEPYKTRWVNGWRKLRSVTVRRRGAAGRLQARGRDRVMAARRARFSAAASAARSGRPSR